MTISPPEQLIPNPGFTAEQYRDPNLFAAVAVPAMRHIACEFADTRAQHYKGVDVGACGVFETPDGQLIVIGSANLKEKPEHEKRCAEVGILALAGALREEHGGGRLAALYVVGPSDPDLISRILGTDAPTLHPCKGKCQHFLADHTAVDDRLLIISGTRDENFIEEFYLLKKLLKRHEEVVVPLTSDELLRTPG